MPRQVDRFLGIVGAGPRDDRRAAGGGFDAQIDDALVLRMAQGRRLAGGADGDQPFRPFGQLPFDEGLERFFIDGARCRPKSSPCETMRNRGPRPTAGGRMQRAC